MKNIISILLILTVLASCVPKKNIIYLQDFNNQTINTYSYETIFKPDDLLKIEIRTLDKEISDLYNPFNNQVNPELIGYLINKDGSITLPLVGDIKAAGLSKEEFKIVLEKKLANYIKNFTTDIRLLNFTINVNGEVTKPGSYKIIGERITLLDALSKAGDLTIYGNRKNIKILRTIDNKIITKVIDLTNSEFLKSDFYYLTQNDIVIVEPRRQKADGTAIGTNITTTFSIISSIITIYLLVNRL